MATPEIPDAVLREAVADLAEHGSQNKAALALGVARQTIQNRLLHAELCGMSSPFHSQSAEAKLSSLGYDTASPETSPADLRRLVGDVGGFLAG